MEKYQQELFNKLAAYSDSDIRMTMSTGRQTGKSLYSTLMAMPFYEILDDHQDYPNHKRVDVNMHIAAWVEAQDISQWKFDNNIAGHYGRYIITPELLTLLALKFSR